MSNKNGLQHTSSLLVFVRLVFVLSLSSPTLLAAESITLTKPLTLDDYYMAALARSESTAIQLEQVHQAEENYEQASSAFFPTINGVASITRIDPLPPGSPQTPANLSQQNLARITLSQPLFRGMREFAVLRQTRNLLTAQKQDYRYAEVLLYRDVLQNFYTILTLEADIANYNKEININRKRESDIRERVRIGRSRTSELLNLQSTISTLLATVEQLRGQLLVAREALFFLSGLDAKTPLLDNTSAPDKLDPLQIYLDGMQNRPDIHASQQRLFAATEAMAVARGEHLPTVDLNGNYYLERPGYLKDSRWDLQLILTVPLYAGGSTQSKVRQANSQLHQAELSQTLRLRQAEQEIRANYQSVNLAQSQLQALQNATAAAEKSYAAQQREYHLGLVSNLEVIQALTTFQQNQRALVRASINVKNAYLQLLTSAAQLPKSLTHKNLKP
jgi:outer membrane protein